MFEHESVAVKYGIEFLSALMEKDYRQDPTFDLSDLQDKLVVKTTLVMLVLSVK